jgi:hypothetical protein
MCNSKLRRKLNSIVSAMNQRKLFNTHLKGLKISPTETVIKCEGFRLGCERVMYKTRQKILITI